MWVSFGLENLRFALHILAGLTFSGVGWLYADAWQGKRRATELLKFLGFYCVAISFFISAVRVEYNFSTISIISSLSPLYLSLGLKLVGYILIIIGLIVDPFPQTTGLRVLLPIGFVAGIGFGLPLFSAAISLLYLYRATYGKEQHLKPIAYSMIAYSIYDLLSYRGLLLQTNNITVFSLVKPYGPVWIAQNLALAVATLVLGRWIWFYLLKRFQTQLYAIYTVSVVTIFLTITICFTGLLLSQVQQQTLQTLKSSVEMFSFVLETKKTSVIAKAQVIAENSTVQDAIRRSSRNAIAQSVGTTGSLTKENTLLVTNLQGQTLLRSDGREGSQDFFSDDPLVKRALAGKKVASVIAKEGALSPDLMIWGAVPVSSNGAVLGVVVVGEVLDNALLDGMKQKTGYDVVGYSQDRLAATTLTNGFGGARPIGSRLSDERIKRSVLEQKQIYSGELSFFDSPYYGVVTPLIDVDGVSVGALGFLIPQLSVLRAAGSSIEYTFLVTTLILALASVPSYIISKYLSDQVS